MVVEIAPSKFEFAPSTPFTEVLGLTPKLDILADTVPLTLAFRRAELTGVAEQAKAILGNAPARLKLVTPSIELKEKFPIASFNTDNEMKYRRGSGRSRRCRSCWQRHPSSDECQSYGPSKAQPLGPQIFNKRKVTSKSSGL